MPHNPDHCTPLKYKYVSHVTLACEDIEHFEEHKVMLAVRVRRVGFFNFGSGRVRVLKKYFGSGRVGYRVFVSNTKSIGY